RVKVAEQGESVPSWGTQTTLEKNLVPRFRHPPEPAQQSVDRACRHPRHHPHHKPPSPNLRPALVTSHRETSLLLSVLLVLPIIAGSARRTTRIAARCRAPPSAWRRSGHRRPRLWVPRTRWWRVARRATRSRARPATRPAARVCGPRPA